MPLLGAQEHYSAGAVCVRWSPLQRWPGMPRGQSWWCCFVSAGVDYCSPSAQARPDGQSSVAQAANDYFQAFKSSHAQSPCRTVPYRTVPHRIVPLLAGSRSSIYVLMQPAGGATKAAPQSQRYHTVRHPTCRPLQLSPCRHVVRVVPPAL
ncbi:hypothetical protein BKA80DRAFT_2093 [Phyllosticta citrichinensis]